MTTATNYTSLTQTGRTAKACACEHLPSGLTFPFAMTVLNDRLLIADNFRAPSYTSLTQTGRTAKACACAALPSGLTFPFAMTVLNDRLLIAD